MMSSVILVNLSQVQAGEQYLLKASWRRRIGASLLSGALSPLDLLGCMCHCL